MALARGLSLITQPDQWARCVHDGTALLPDGSIELSWANPSSGPHCDSTSSALRPGGLAFDRWCRVYRSRPEQGRVDVSTLDEAAHPALASVSVSATAASERGPLRSPAGLAVDRRQRLYIAETGAGVVHVIDLWGQRLLRRVPIACGRPLDVAADCGRAIALTTNAKLVILDGRRGTVPGPALVRPCYPSGLYAVRLAPGPLVLWRANDGTSAVARADGTVLLESSHITDIDVSPSGLLVVGGVPGEPVRRFQMVGDALLEQEPLEALGYDGGAICVAPNGRIAFTARTEVGYGWTSGSAAVHESDGSVTTYRLDSGGYRTRWGRFFADACLPPGTSLGVRFISSDDDSYPDSVLAAPPARGARTVPDPQATPPLAPQHLLDAAPPATALYRRPDRGERPWLPVEPGSQLKTYETPVLAPPGRYLWVQLTLHGTQRVSPRVRDIRVERPGHPLLNSLPKAWSRIEADGDYLQRFLAPAEGLLHELDERADRRAVLVSAHATGSANLDWLASFAGIVLDQRWSDDARRTLVAEAFQLFRRRGTKATLLRILEIYLGYPVELVEAWQLRGLAGATLGSKPGAAYSPEVGGGASESGGLGRFAIGGSEPGRTTYTPAAHRFTLLIPGELAAEQRSVVENILDVHRPAHTLFEICELGAGMRVGSRLRLDLTSYVGPAAARGPAVVGQVLVGADGVVGLPALGARLGSDSSVGQVRVG